MNRSETGERRSGAAGRSAPPTSPFYLTVDSPIDQAPSVDAVAAARLRRLDVTHVTHLMQHDANRLADALGLTSVSASTIRRWQAECRLACRVPHLRGFDARVLVGCGVTDPEQLAAIHPFDLLQEVEAFLATDRGQDILLSGSSQELSRITSWIAAANSSPSERAAAAARSETDDYAGQGEANHFAQAMARRREPSSRTRSDRKTNGRRRRSGVATRSETGTDGRSRHSGNQSARGISTRRNIRRGDASHTTNSLSAAASSSGTPESDYGQSADDRRRRRRADGNSARRRQRVVRLRSEDDGESFARADTNANGQSSAEGKTTVESWRFYLHRDSPVVDAPSIGERMAERLEAIDIQTVNDLLNADPETLAADLDHRRVDSEVVLQWQQQAELVCRVPMLRGHDAQLLVMAEVTTPEELAAADEHELFECIDPISRSKAGARVLRGGKRPDLAEVTEWIRFAQHTRELIAA